MIQLEPNSLTLKPKPRAYTAKDFPLKRPFNDYGYFELSGAAVTTKAARDVLDKQYRWDTLAVLSLLGLSDYVARNKTPPKHTLITYDLYDTTFDFELKRLNGITVVTEKPGFSLNAAGDLIFKRDPALGISVIRSGDNLTLTYDPAIGTVQVDAAGNVTWRASATAAGGTSVLACPLIEGFADNAVEFRTAQPFSSGNVRQIAKRRGFLRELSFRQDLTPDEAVAFVQFYRAYDHEPLTLAWVTAYFGQGRRFVFGQSPWELKVAGSRFDLSVQGYIV